LKAHPNLQHGHEEARRDRARPHGQSEVLFLDEPTRGLDLPAKRETWKLLRTLASQEQVTTFLSSHDAHEIRSLCDEISVLAKGEVVYTGRTEELGHDLDTFEERLIGLLTRGA
jgi:ABC-2 type transport system ATP-binding protein